MKPIEFKEQNKILTGKEPIKPLPIYNDGDMCQSCWRLNFAERLNVLVFGKIWLQIRGGLTQPPVSLICGRKGFE